MSFMVEAYLRSDQSDQESRLSAFASNWEGRLTHEEEKGPESARCLTFEFESPASAKKFIECLCIEGIHVEGPYDY